MNQTEFSSKIAKEYHKNLLNIMTAVQQAGGSVSVMSADMTIHDLLMCCATNSITIDAIHQVKNEKKKEFM